MFRKVMVGVLVVTMILASFAYAESQWFAKPVSEIELDELLEMKKLIDNEIMVRFEKIDGIIIEPGLYIVGEDIPEGNYYFEGVEGRYSTSIHVYPSIDKMGTFDDIQEIYGIGYSDSASSPKSGKVILRNGNAIEFVQGPAIIHPFLGLMN